MDLFGQTCGKFGVCLVIGLQNLFVPATRKRKLTFRVFLFPPKKNIPHLRIPRG
jgi:hypothetical protein